MAISLKTGGAWVEATADATATLVGTPAAGDRYFLWVAYKDQAITCQVTASSGNWIEIAEFKDGTVVTGNGTGSVTVCCYYRDWVSGDVNPTIDFSASPNIAEYVMQLWQKASTDGWEAPVFQTAAWPQQTGPATVNASSSAVTVRDGAAVMSLLGIRDDSAAVTSLITDITDAGVTFNGAMVKSPANCKSSTTNNDMSADVAYRLVTTGAASQTLSLAATLAATETGAILWVVQNLAPAMSTLTDTFDSGIGVLWAKGGDDVAQVNASNNGVRIDHTTGPQSNGLFSGFYNLAGSSVYVQINDFGNQSLSSHQVLLILQNGTNAVRAMAGGGNLYFEKVVGGSTTTISSVALDLVAHRWLRIRESAGSTFWDTSPDGVAWTNRESVANPITVTYLQAVLAAQCWQAEASASYATFDNVNSPPAIGKLFTRQQAVNRAGSF